MIFQRVATELLFHHVLPFPARRAGRPLFSFGRRQVGTHSFEYLCGHADRFAQSRMRVNRLADVHRIATHFDRQANLPDQIARMGADNAAADQSVVRFIE